MGLHIYCIILSYTIMMMNAIDIEILYFNIKNFQDTIYNQNKCNITIFPKY